jgi:hypothetical protein
MIESHSSRLEQVEGRISGLKDKIDIYEKTEESLGKNSRAAKGTHQNSENSSKDQTCESWVLKKEKRSKSKVYIIYSRKFLKKCSGTGSHQDTKQT